MGGIAIPRLVGFVTIEDWRITLLGAHVGPEGDWRVHTLASSLECTPGGQGTVAFVLLAETERMGRLLKQ